MAIGSGGDFFLSYYFGDGNQTTLTTQNEMNEGWISLFTDVNKLILERQNFGLFRYLVIWSFSKKFSRLDQECKVFINICNCKDVSPSTFS